LELADKTIDAIYSRQITTAFKHIKQLAIDGFDFNVYTQNGMTLLHHVLALGSEGVAITEFMTSDNRVSAKTVDASPDVSCPLIWVAAASNSFECYKLVKERLYKNELPKKFDSEKVLTHVALKNVRIMEDLYKLGISITALDDLGFTPLLMAAITDELDPNVVDFLIAKEVDLDVISNIKSDSYCLAIGMFNYPFVQRMLPHRAPVYALEERPLIKYNNRETGLKTKDLAMHVLKRAWTKLIEEGDSASVKQAIKRLEPYISEQNRIGEYARFCHDNLK
jgi:hypothetical protein